MWASLPGMEEVLARLAEIWKYPLFNVDGNTITPKKLVIALAVFLAGLFLARLIARRIGSRLLPRLHVGRGPAVAIQKLAYYLLLVVVAMVALQLAGVPLAVFTIIGGALALGVGFGSQNVVNNFISGLILLIERPIKVGDLIEVDGKRGVVEAIGARATDLRNVEGADCLLPNSMLLESAVVNWHHHDDRVRARVAVGVAYGSPCERVRELLLQVAEEVEDVLTDPDPAVLFREFGDNSLAFELLAWCRPGNAFDWLRIESELRFAIDRLFSENGIVIAFPQRDVHLDTTAPVRVEMVQ